jgi:RNA polymerase I-specific transcription initiation factor RRN3
LLTSRSSSLAGRKRPRESDGANASAAAAARAQAARRTKSVGDTGIRQPRPSGGAGGNAKDREAFQRGLIAVFVPKALKDSATKGDMTNYNDLLAHFLPTPTNPNPPLPPLLPLLRAISAHVSLLVPEVHGALVSAIIGLPWAYGDERFVKTYVGWAGVLVSAHPTWTKEVVQTASSGLAWREFLA